MVFNGNSVDVLHGVNLAVDIKVVIIRPDLHVAGGQNQIGVIHRADHIHDAQLVRFQFQRIHINHDLPVAPAERLRHGRARHIGDLVAHVELAEVAQLRLVQAFAFQGNQTHRQAGRVKLQNHRRQGAGRQLAQIRHREVGDAGHGGIGIEAGLKINLDQAHARQRTRFNVIHAAGQREEALKASGDVRFDLLRRHAGKNVATTTTGILIGGNKSTGIRTRLVTPTTQVIRQMTMMRYGRRMAKRDMTAK
jgi:hypothetical protein